MKKILLTLLAIVGWSGAQATNYYVSSSSGTNTTANGRGLSPTNAFATIQYAADLTLPGDTVFVRAGTYVNTGTGSSLCAIRRSGAPGAYITYRNYPGDAQKPLLQFRYWYGFGFANDVSYVQIIGFRIQGNNRNVDPINATNQPGGCATNGVGTPDPQFNGIGISINGKNSSNHPTHLLVRNNELFECGQAGVVAIQADYVTIENNLVYDNSWYSIYGSSGISVLSSWESDNTTGYRTIVRNNVVFGNELRVPWFSTTCRGFTDGNGIIIDTNTTFAYTGRTLVANNLAVDNGGAGITAFQVNHVDLINNTLYHNAKNPFYIQGDLVIGYSNDVLAQNNIISASTGKPKGTVKANTGGIVLNANLLFGGNNLSVFNNTGTYTNTNTLGADPQLLGPTTNWRTGNFRLQSTSPAIDAGVNNLLSPTDLAGNPRVTGSAPDLGAYEYSMVLATTAATLTAANMVLYPNPAQATFAVFVPAGSGGTQVRAELLNGLGQVVRCQTADLPTTGTRLIVNASGLSAGVYIVRLQVGTSTLAKRVVLQ